MWFFIAAGAMWNNIFRRYVIGVHKWLVDDVLVKLRANEDWHEEAEELFDTVMPNIDEHVNESFGFILPLMIVLGVNSGMIIASFTGEIPTFLNFMMATGNAACAVGFIVLRQRYYDIAGTVEGYKTLLVAEDIYEEHKDDDTLE